MIGWRSIAVLLWDGRVWRFQTPIKGGEGKAAAIFSFSRADRTHGYSCTQRVDRLWRSSTHGIHTRTLIFKAFTDDVLNSTAGSDGRRGADVSTDGLDGGGEFWVCGAELGLTTTSFGSL